MYQSKAPTKLIFGRFRGTRKHDRHREVNTSLEWQGTDAVLTVTGRVTMQSAHTLLAAVKEMPRKTQNLVVNLSQVNYMDTSGIGVLVTALKLFKNRGAGFALAQVNERVRQVMEMSGLVDLFRIYPNDILIQQVAETGIQNVAAPISSPRQNRGFIWGYRNAELACELRVAPGLPTTQSGLPNNRHQGCFWS